MKDNANVESSATDAAATEQKANTQSKKELNMTSIKSNQFIIPKSTIVSEMNQQEVIDFIADNVEAGYFPKGVMYAVYWKVFKEMGKKSFSLIGSMNFVIAQKIEAGRFNAEEIYQLIASTADKVEALYSKVEPIADVLNAGLNNIHQKRPTNRITVKGDSVRDEEFKPLSFHPFTRRTEMDGAMEEKTLSAFQLTDDFENEMFQDERAEDELAKFMEQSEMKHGKTNMSQLILGAKSDVTYLSTPR